MRSALIPSWYESFGNIFKNPVENRFATSWEEQNIHTNLNIVRI